MRSTFKRDVIIGISGYEDLFSDFDPRPFVQKAVSDDFMTELNKLTAEDDAQIRTLKFQMPHSARTPESEMIIAKRLEHDFARIHAKTAHDVRSIYTSGIVKAIFGMLALMGALSVTNFDIPPLWRNLCLVVLEPAGWFFMWSGFEETLNGSRPLRLKRDFYAQLRRCKIEFASNP